MGENRIFTDSVKASSAALLGLLRRRMTDTPQMPVLRVSAAELKTTRLTTPERYLLSRIDGKRGHAVAMAHPDLLATSIEQAREDAVALVARGRGDEGAPVFGVVPAFDRAAFAAAVEPAYPEYYKKFDKKLIEAIRDTK